MSQNLKNLVISDEAFQHMKDNSLVPLKNILDKLNCDCIGKYDILKKLVQNKLLSSDDIYDCMNDFDHLQKLVLSFYTNVPYDYKIYNSQMDFNTSFDHKDLEMTKYMKEMIVLTQKDLRLRRGRLIKDKIDPFEQEQLEEEAQQLKSEGNSYFQKGEYEKAHQCFEKGYNLLKYYPSDQLLKPLQNNYAMTLVATGNFLKAIEIIDDALIDQVNNEKLYYRKALAYQGLGQIDQAKQQFLKVLEITPDNDDVREQLDELLHDNI